MDYKIHLNVFEGPLDLLLYFIRRDEINIYDIPIAKITQEYLEYLSLMDTLNLRVAGEFVEMAATLMRIKAQMLIPRIADGVENDTIEDPRTELVERLIEYQRYKELSRDLADLEERQLPYFPRKVDLSYIDKTVSAEEVLQKVSLFDILAAFKKVLDRLPETKPHQVEGEGATIGDQVKYIYRFFIKSNRVTFSELAKNIPERVTLITTFLAILEMAKTQQIRILQATVFDDFILEKVE